MIVKKGRGPDQWSRMGEVLANFSTRQLAYIGAISMLYNAAEYEVYRAAWGCMVYPAGPVNLTHRMAGTKPVIEILELSLRNNDLVDDTLFAEIHESLSENFCRLKTLRDAVIHARIKRFDFAIGAITKKQAQQSEVLISEDALAWLAEALNRTYRELEQLVSISHLVHQGLRHSERTERFSEALQASIEQYRQFRNHRSGHPKEPKFPEVPPLSAGA